MNKENPVMVTTKHKGVFFGYEKSRTGSTITLTGARMCVSWSHDLQGVLGLAVKGPSGNCRIGPAVSEIELMDVTSVSVVSTGAVKKWESAPWT